MKTIILLLPILIFNFLHSSEFNFLDEQYTLSYQAAQIKATNSCEDIPVLVRDSVSIVFDTYRPQFNDTIRATKADAARRGIKGGALVSLIMKEVYPFIDVIVNEIDSVAKNLSPEGKQHFWVYAEEEITRRIENYSLSQGGIKDGIAWRVKNLVNMKKAIG